MQYKIDTDRPTVAPVIYVDKLGPPIQKKTFNEIVASYPAAKAGRSSDSDSSTKKKQDSKLPCSCLCALHPTEEEGSVSLDSPWPYEFYADGELVEHPDILSKIRAIDELAHQLNDDRQALEQKGKELEGQRIALRNYMERRSQRRIVRMEQYYWMSGGERKILRRNLAKEME